MPKVTHLKSARINGGKPIALEQPRSIHWFRTQKRKGMF